MRNASFSVAIAQTPYSFSRANRRSLGDAEHDELGRMERRDAHPAEQPAVVAVVLAHPRPIAADEVGLGRLAAREVVRDELVVEEGPHGALNVESETGRSARSWTRRRVLRDWAEDSSQLTFKGAPEKNRREGMRIPAKGCDQTQMAGRQGFPGRALRPFADFRS